MHPDYFKVFNVQGLRIYYKWLFPEERAFLWKLYKNRCEVFPSRTVFVDGGFVLKGLTSTLAQEHRRELVRDFVWLGLSQRGVDWNGLFLRVFQRLMLSSKCDRFVYECHGALQGQYPLKNMLCVYYE